MIDGNAIGAGDAFSSIVSRPIPNFIRVYTPTRILYNENKKRVIVWHVDIPYTRKYTRDAFSWITGLVDLEEQEQSLPVSVRAAAIFLVFVESIRPCTCH